MNIRTCMMLYRIWMGCVLRRICMAPLWICRALLRICRALLRTCMGSVLRRIYIWKEQGEHHNKPSFHNIFNIFLINVFLFRIDQIQQANKGWPRPIGCIILILNFTPKSRRLVANLWKVTCKIRHSMDLRHPVLSTLTTKTATRCNILQHTRNTLQLTATCSKYCPR